MAIAQMHASIGLDKTNEPHTSSSIGSDTGGLGGFKESCGLRFSTPLSVYLSRRDAGHGRLC